MDFEKLSRWPACALLAAATALSSIAGANAWETTVHKFVGTDGWIGETGAMVADAGGTLYGVALTGGDFTCFMGCGTVFSITPPLLGNPIGKTATPNVIYRFKDTPDANNPVAVILDGKGGLYGATSGGGVVTSNCPFGCGAIFHLTPPANGKTEWSFATVYNFKGGRDGASPVGRMVMDKRGVLYGMTSNGGGTNNCEAWALPGSCGTVFRLEPMNAARTAWRETVLYRFTAGRDGGTPAGELAIDPATGVLYGSTWFGGRNASNDCCGTIFKLAPPAQKSGAWRFTTIFRFSGRDGSGPMGALALDKGMLYGGTAFGGAFGHGAVFRLTPPARSGGRWTNTTLYSTQFKEGDRFESGVTRAADGTLYVAARHGGNNTSTAANCPNKGCGTVFKLVPPANPSGQWRYVNLHRFSGVDGTAPSAALILVGRHAFGTTWYGGNLSLAKCLSFFFRTSGCGVIYDVQP